MRIRKCASVTLMACLQLIVWWGRASAAPPTDVAGLEKKETSRGYFNIPLKTSGGVQFWGDEIVYSGWRIQRNCFTGHCRLLDSDDRRRAWGTYDQCHEAFDAVLHKQGVPAMRGHVVIVLHGLAGCRPMMDSMCTYLRDQGKFCVQAVAYPSTRSDVDSDAAALGRVVAAMPDADRIDFVAHSLGNVVVRRYLAMNTDPAKGKQPDPRIKRIVMPAPPNHGAPEADKLVALDVTGQVVGPAARQLTVGWRELEPKLCTPACEFGILAGGQGDGKGYNALIPGDDDGVVAVEVAKLAGARDYRVVPAMHVRFMRKESVQKLTLQFLKDGCFETEAKRTPL